MLDRTAPHLSAAPARSDVALSARTVTLATAALCLLGFVLRVGAARGDLWLDEIWSMILVGKTTSFWDVLLALPHDNNHVLNSLWLKIVGAQAPPLLVRLPAILFGTLCVPVAARIGARISPACAVVLAAVAAIDDTFVQFGSEARGYSGLMLAFLVAIDALETRLLRDGSRKSLLAFALAIAFGTFSHLLMVEATLLLCATFAIRLILAEGLSGAWPRRLVPIVLAAAAGTLPALACLAVSVVSGPLHVGLSSPFSVAAFAEGFGGIVRTTLGFWPYALAPVASELLLPVIGFGVVAGLTKFPPQRRVLPALGLFGLPIAHAVLHLPNQIYARFHLISGVCLALFVAELATRAWRGGTFAKTLVLVGAIGFAAGQTVQLTQFLVLGRGDFMEATALMVRQGPIGLTVLPSVAAPETAAVMRWYAKRNGVAAKITLVPDAELCASPPDWVVIVHRPDDAKDMSDAERLAGRPCRDRFEVQRKFPSYGLSGFSWTILRRHPSS